MVITNTCNSDNGNITDFPACPVTECISTNERYRPFVADQDTASCQDLLGDLAKLGGCLERDTCWLAKRLCGVGEDSRTQDNAAADSLREDALSLVKYARARTPDIPLIKAVRLTHT